MDQSKPEDSKVFGLIQRWFKSLIYVKNYAIFLLAGTIYTTIHNLNKCDRII